MPFQTSPGKDDGYDVSDYYNVDPRMVTLGDFVEFTHGAKQRGMRVLIDLVVNHTFDQHPWFAASPPRTPMQWSTEPRAGFTKNEKPILPVIFRRTLRISTHQRRGSTV